MMGPWQPFENATESYMRRRVLGLFWLYRQMTDNEVRSRFRSIIDGYAAQSQSSHKTNVSQSPSATRKPPARQ